jgi:hypothetical protein
LGGRICDCGYVLATGQMQQPAGTKNTSSSMSSEVPSRPFAGTNAEGKMAEAKCALCAGLVPKGQAVMVEIKSETETSYQVFHPECARVYQSTFWPKLGYYLTGLLLFVLVLIYYYIRHLPR